jgi:hypothetical protein
VTTVDDASRASPRELHRTAPAVSSGAAARRPRRAERPRPRRLTAPTGAAWGPLTWGPRAGARATPGRRSRRR